MQTGPIAAVDRRRPGQGPLLWAQEVARTEALTAMDWTEFVAAARTEAVAAVDWTGAIAAEDRIRLN